MIENILIENISEEKEPVDEEPSTDVSMQVEKSQQLKRCSQDYFNENRKHTCISNVSLY